METHTPGVGWSSVVVRVSRQTNSVFLESGITIIIEHYSGSITKAIRQENEIWSLNVGRGENNKAIHRTTVHFGEKMQINRRFNGRIILGQPFAVALTKVILPCMNF